MKLLVIGKEERVRRNTRNPDFLKKYEIVYAASGTPEEELLRIGGDADFLLADAISPVTAGLIARMPNLKLIHSEGVAFDRIDIGAAAERRIYVCNCKGMNAGAVAEQAVLLMLGLLRDVCNGDAAMRKGLQIQVKESYMVSGSLAELGECTVGLLGFGDIAKATAKLLGAFGARVIYWSRRQAPPETEEAYGVSFCSLDQLLAESDIVSLHMPVTEETRGMADAAFFAKMKPGAYLVNTARGELVDGQALLAAIRSGRLAGAGLDTVAGEPVRADNPIFGAEEAVEKKILYSCHLGGITGASFKRGYDMIWSDIEKAAAGGRPDHVVNL